MDRIFDRKFNRQTVIQPVDQDNIHDSNVVNTRITDVQYIITEQIAQLMKKCDELERRNSELNTFANVIIHDLKAPLRGINYFVETIDRDQDNRFTLTSSSSFELLRKKICRMSILLDDIFAYFFNTQIHVTTERIQWLNFFNDIKASLQIPPGFIINSWNMPVQFDIQKLPLQQVLVNIIQNAIKYQDDQSHGMVMVLGSQDQDYYYFYIGDNGPGIPQDYLQDMFKPLSRLRSCSDGNIEGSGLGLAIVNKIIQHHHGKIAVRSCEGSGTSFYFSWRKITAVT